MTEPTAAAPEELGDLFVRYFTGGDLDSLAALYDDDAIFVPASGEQARGRDAIRAALQAMHATGATIRLRLRRIHTTGEICLLSNDATVSGATPDGSDLVTTTTEVLRRRPDGTWCYVLDDPYFSV